MPGTVARRASSNLAEEAALRDRGGRQVDLRPGLNVNSGSVLPCTLWPLCGPFEGRGTSGDLNHGSAGTLETPCDDSHRMDRDMPIQSFKAGSWYPSKSKVRAHFGQYWKGILVRGDELGIVFAYRGARRKHYLDRLDLDTMTLSYIGEGKAERGDQVLNSRNAALADAVESKRSVGVFFDVGDVRLPASNGGRPEKHYLAGGKWFVTSARFRALREEKRKVWVFTLEPEAEETVAHLGTMFGARGGLRFERQLRAFAGERSDLHRLFGSIIRSRDSIAGEIGEYYAVQAFNRANPELPLVRLRANYKDLDAVQIKTGRRFAIKTIGKVPGNTSSIWSKTVRGAIDEFLIVHLDQESLAPRAVYQMSAGRVARHFLVQDSYQGSQKLRVDASFLKAATKLAFEA